MDEFVDLLLNAISEVLKGGVWDVFKRPRLCLQQDPVAIHLEQRGDVVSLRFIRDLGGGEDDFGITVAGIRGPYHL